MKYFSTNFVYFYRQVINKYIPPTFCNFIDKKLVTYSTAVVNLSENSSDQEVVKAVLSGDKQNFALLMERYERVIIAYVLPMVNYNKQDTEDICSNVWIKVYQKLDSYNENYKFLSWIYQISRNVCIDHLRKNIKKEISVDLQEPIYEEMIKEENEDLCTHGELAKILDELNPLDRDLLILKYLQGYSVTEIGEMQKLKPSQVSVKLTRAKDRAQKLVHKLYPRFN